MCGSHLETVPDFRTLIRLLFSQVSGRGAETPPRSRFPWLNPPGLCVCVWSATALSPSQSFRFWAYKSPRTGGEEKKKKTAYKYWKSTTSRHNQDNANIACFVHHYQAVRFFSLVQKKKKERDEQRCFTGISSSGHLLHAPKIPSTSQCAYRSLLTFWPELNRTRQNPRIQSIHNENQALVGLVKGIEINLASCLTTPGGYSSNYRQKRKSNSKKATSLLKFRFKQTSVVQWFGQQESSGF